MKLDPEKAKPFGQNIVTEFVNCPLNWDLNDSRYTWLTDEDKERLEAYDFDYGDIMYCASRFDLPSMVAKVCLCTMKDLNDYCMILWRKPFELIYNALIIEARHQFIGEVFDPHARRGSSTAMAIMAHSVMKLDNETEQKELKVRLVNDLDSDDDDDE